MQRRYCNALTTKLFIGSFAAFLFAATAVAQDAPADIRARVESAVAKVKPALVRIQVVTSDYMEGREQKFQASGSGAIITKDGYVVTNHHVAGHASLITCTLATKEEVEADLIGTDALSDIAVIKLKNENGREFPTASFGDSSKLLVGDSVLAMGSPMALSQSVTLGIVSNVEMIMPRFMARWGGLELDGEDVGSFVRWIGHDAAIYGGNSGGPLVNLDGEIIGINELDMALSGAIPSDVARKSVEQLTAHGRVKRSWIGVNVQAQLKEHESQNGVLIASVIKGSPADQAGIKSGDMVLRLGDKDVNVKFDEEIPEFNRYVADLPIGQPANAVLLRNGSETNVVISPIEREEALPKQVEIKRWGITARNISLVLAKEMKRENQEGAQVTSLRPGGPSGEAKPRIEQNDVIVDVAGAPIKNVSDLIAVTDRITKGETKPVPTLVTFERKSERIVTVVKVGIRELDDPGLEVAKAWLPAITQVLTRDIAEQLGKPDLTGFRVTRVYPNTTAEKAGLKTGDFILSVDGQRLEASAPEDYEELPALIRQYKIGTVAQFLVLRDGQEVTVPVELAASPKLNREMKKRKDENFEFTVREVSYMDKAKEKWEEAQSGVLVEEVQPGGWAAVAYLDVGDLLIEVDAEKIDSLDAFEIVMKRIEEAKPKVVLLKVLRGIHTRFIEIEPKWRTEG